MLLKYKKNPKASIIIPNWNGKELISICLKSLKGQTFKNFEVIIVDNGSIDGSVEFIEGKYPEFFLIKLDKNIGFSPAVNLGIRSSKGEYIFLLNNDTKVEKSCMFYLVKALDSHPDIGMVAAKMLQFNNPKIIDSFGDYIDCVGHADNIGFGKIDGEKFNKGGYVFLVTGGGSIFKKEVFKKVGYFDEDYFAYFEDVDFCLRAQLQGFKAWVEPRAKILHKHKATSNKNRSFLEYLQFRNMMQTIIKDFPKELLLKDFNLIKIVLVNINTVRYLWKEGYFLSALKAEAFILKNLFSLLKKRKEIQSNISVDMNRFIENFQPKRITFFGLLKNGI